MYTYKTRNISFMIDTRIRSPESSEIGLYRSQFQILFYTISVNMQNVHGDKII